MTLHSLKGKIALITGGTKGIGLAISRRFASEGASVIMASTTASPSSSGFRDLIDHATPAAAAAEVAGHQQTSPARPQVHAAVALDVSSPSSWKSLLRSHPEIDILVNCAGVTLNKLLVPTSEEEISSVISTNLAGTILGCKLVGRSMILQLRQDRQRQRQQQQQQQQDKGEPDDFLSGVVKVPTEKSIINISSLLAQKSVTGTSVYAASKAGILGLTTSLSQEYGRQGIRVNAILPGYIKTSMTERMYNSRDIFSQHHVEPLLFPNQNPSSHSLKK